MSERKIIDVVVAVAKKGGVEKVMNAVCRYFENENYKVRMIQMVYEGDAWYDNPEEFYYIYKQRDNQSDRSFIEGYKKFLVSNGNPDIIIASGWPMMSLVCKRACQELGADINVISWTHNDIDKYVLSHYGGVECLEVADANFVLNKKTEMQIKKYNQDLIIYNIGNFVKIKEDYDQKTVSNNTLVYIGRLDQMKRVDTIIHAIAQSKADWILTVIGDGNSREELESLARENEVEHKIKWLGWKENPDDYLEGQYAFVLASESEGFCLAAVEASERGLPVIATPVGIIPEYIIPGHNGYLFEMGNAGMLAQILDYISEGKLPRLSRKDCHESIRKYGEEIVLLEMKKVVEKYIKKY